MLFLSTGEKQIANLNSIRESKFSVFPGLMPYSPIDTRMYIRLDR